MLYLHEKIANPGTHFDQHHIFLFFYDFYLFGKYFFVTFAPHK